MKKILGLDFDDVLFDANASLAEFHNTRYGTSLTTEDNVDFWFEKLWGCSTEETFRRMDEYSESEYHRDAPIVKGAREALERLQEIFEIIVITARPEHNRPVTEAWLQKNLPAFISRIYFTDRFVGGAPLGVAKSEVCKTAGVTHFVEDALHWAEDVAQNSPKTEVFLFDSPWNRRTTPARTTRVRSWADIEKRLMPQ